MTEYFVVANSFAAPFFSDTSHHFVAAEDAAAALVKLAAEYAHPCKLYAAVCYTDANAYHKGAPPLAKWLCKHERERLRLTAGRGSYSYMGHGPGDFEIDHERYTFADPYAGEVIAA